MKYYLYDTDLDERIEVTKEAMNLNKDDFVQKNDTLYKVIQKVIFYDKNSVDIDVTNEG
jgi:hypothetical protein